MAEKVDSMPPDGRGTKQNYPWDRWLDGSVWRLERGVDFETSPRSMQSQAINAGRKRGVLVTARILGGCVYVQARPD